MAVPVIESTATNTGTSTGSLIITKPTGLAVGEWLIAFLFTTDGTSHSINTPSGWTAIGTVNVTDSFRRFTTVYKVADSGDTAASDFTFTASTSVDTFLGSLLRVSGVAQLGDSSSDSYFTTSTSLSFTHSLIPESADSLLISANAFRVGNNVATVSGYNSTPSKTWSEVIDFGLNFGSSDPGMAIASATAGSTTEVTATSATLSSAKESKGSWLISLTPSIDAAGTVALKSLAPSFYAETSGTGASGSINSLALSPSLNTVSGVSTTGTVLTGNDKNVTVWTPNSK